MHPTRSGDLWLLDARRTDVSLLCGKMQHRIFLRSDGGEGPLGELELVH